MAFFSVASVARVGARTQIGTGDADRRRRMLADGQTGSSDTHDDMASTAGHELAGACAPAGQCAPTNRALPFAKEKGLAYRAGA